MPYGNQDGPSMESAKQEKYDLLHKLFFRL